ncbi:MAG TPA: PaaI family thioesterase [Verrucomicrobiae bacterium]|nr:PaaI family thioesterase [Verrucomicrobiae bacterium]
MKELVREHTFRWTDPRAILRSADAEIAGLQWLQMMQAGEVEPPPLASALGMTIEAIEEGRVVFSMRGREWMCNPAVVIHGGITATLLDTVLTLAVVTKLPAKKSAQTIEMNLHYVRPLLPDGTAFRAEGLAVHVGGSIATAEGRVYNEAGKLVSHGTATLALLDVTAMLTRSPASP